ncbi:hypothetical protein EMCRGX_G004720 [Ephydatia muelleri]
MRCQGGEEDDPPLVPRLGTRTGSTLLFSIKVFLSRVMRCQEGGEEDDPPLVPRLGRLLQDGWASLMRAAYHGHANCVRALVNRGADVNHCNNVGRTSLMYASGISNAECVKVLLDGGAQINLKEEERLMEASRNGTLEEAIKSIQAEMNCDKDWYLARIRDYLAYHACSGLPLAGLLKPHPLKGRCPLPLSGLISPGISGRCPSE